jgi:hypothetical protein
MFHVEHFGGSAGIGHIDIRWYLVMETKQEYHTKNDSRQKDLADVKVQYLLVGARGVAENRFFLSRRFMRNSGID